MKRVGERILALGSINNVTATFNVIMRSIAVNVDGMKDIKRKHFANSRDSDFYYNCAQL